MHEKSEEYRHLSEKERALQRELEAMRNEKVTFFLKCLHTHLIYINFCSVYMEIYVHIMFFDKIIIWKELLLLWGAEEPMVINFYV